MTDLMDAGRQERQRLEQICSELGIAQVWDREEGGGLRKSTVS